MKSRHYFNAASAGRIAVILLALTVLPFSNLFSNNLNITGLSVNQGAKTVTFTISWDHSWRNSGSPANWDAAWVIVKFRDCSADANTTQFTQGVVSETIGDHSFGTPLEPTQIDGTGNAIDPSPDNTGVMLRRNAVSTSGSISASVTLKISNMPTSGTLDTRVYGVEMVYVPSAAFYLGDGNGSTGSTYTFTTTSSSSYIPVYMTSENAITIYERYCCTMWCPSGTCAIGAGFPKGFKAFYIMKYEISQGQYVDFLNAQPVQMTSHFPGQNGLNRNTITNTGNPPNQYSANNRLDRACNWLSWTDVAAYLDWACLRPLTEMEYEKACRGTNSPNTGEYAWGSTTATQPATTGITGPENGTEIVNTAGANYGGSSTYTTANGGDAGQGPLRSGIFATPTTTTRQQTGAGFYGAMDLSGNVDEFYISVQAGFSGNASNGGVSEGDGLLGASYDMNVSNWPSATAPGNLVMRRGAGLGAIPISDRSDSGTGRDKYSGGRGGR